MTDRPADVRVLVGHPVADQREGLAAVLAREPCTVVVGSVATGREVARLATDLRPDVIVLAAGIAGPDVVATTRTIMSTGPTPIVLVTTDDPDQLGHATDALAEGALSVQRTPDPAAIGVGARFAAVVAALADVSVVRRRWSGGGDAGAAEVPTRPPPARPWRRARLVAIAGSTGAPVALQQLLAGLPADLPAPVLVVQHLPPGYVASFARWLDAATRLQVTVGTAGHLPQPGEVVLAPDGAHLDLDADGRLGRGRAAAVDGFRPSASVLFGSVAAVHGPAVLAIVLSGMGRDGVDGLHRVRDRGGHIVAQDEATSVVFGMPGAAVAAGLAHRVVAVDDLASELLSIVGHEGGER